MKTHIGIAIMEILPDLEAIGLKTLVLEKKR